MFPSDSSVLSFTTNPFNSDVATEDTVRLMYEISNEAASSQLVTNATATALSNTTQYSSPKEIADSIFWWVKRHLKFSNDETLIMDGLHRPVGEYGTDLLITPDVLLTMSTPEGDCDDYSMLGRSMLLNAGFHPDQVKFCTVAANRSEPDTFSHVYVVVYLPYRYVMDMSHGVCPGWEYNKSTRIQEW